MKTTDNKFNEGKNVSSKESNEKLICLKQRNKIHCY